MKIIKSRKIIQTTLLAGMACGLLFVSKGMAGTVNPPKNVIGFFQSYDDPNSWLFNGTGESLANSGYTMLVDAFWTNYPYCWGDGTGRPGLGSPIPACKGVIDAPGAGTSNQVYTDFWMNYQGQPAPSDAGEAYNQYWTSLHTSGPMVISQLRKQINSIGENNITHQKIKLLAGIGGWNMGGSAAGVPNTPKPPEAPAWAALLKDPNAFAKAMSDIVHLKVNGTVLYDGIDIDIETLYGEGCENNNCTPADQKKAVDHLVAALVKFKQLEPNAILSTSPRASDIACDQQYCSWNNQDGLGFMGEVLQKMAAQQVYFDEINPQFYNDDSQRNIPNGQENGKITYGNQVISILEKLKETGAIGPNTSLNIGVLAQTNSHEVDTGGAPTAGNPGVAKESVKELWERLKIDPALSNSHINIDGIMTWSVNLALAGTGIGGNVRSLNSPAAHVIPYNWPADLFS